MTRQQLFDRLGVWARRTGLARKLTIALTVAVTASGLATYAALTRSGPLGGPDPHTVFSLLMLDLVFMLLLAALVGRRLTHVWAERRAGAAGARLHVRLVMMFSVVAITPAILVAVFSALLINFGVEQWFNKRVSTAVDESLAVAKAYLEEHQQVIGGDALAMANDINREGPALLRNPDRLAQMVGTQAAVRALTEALVFDATGQVLARAGLAFSMELSIDRIPHWAFDRARSGDVAVLTNPGDQRVRALVKLEGSLIDSYLYVGRFVDPKVIDHMERTSRAVAEYQQLEGTRSGLELTFSAIFAMVAVLLLLAAMWVGLTLATQLATPIIRLIDAAERVRGGDLSARVEDEGATDELGSLSRAFNRMTSQLDAQRRELVGANRELDERRRFTETVLAGVSSGVIGLDRQGNITLPNRSAVEYLSTEAEAMIGRPLREVVPEMAPLLDMARRRPDRSVQDEMKLVRAGRSLVLLVRIVAEQDEVEVTGYVVTIDDITELLSAQRKAAWADVARRIAHEIKNPLTPIQLSAERLKRKYLKEISSDRGNLSDLHRHHHPPSRRYRPHGRRVLGVCPHARAGDEARRSAAGGKPGTVPVPHRLSRRHLCQRYSRRRGQDPLRRPAGRPGLDQSAEERRRGHPQPQGQGPAQGPRRRRDRTSPGMHGHRRRGQRHRPARGAARSLDRALCDDARQGHRIGPCHRQENHGRPWRRIGAGRPGWAGRPRQSGLPGPRRDSPYRFDGHGYDPWRMTSSSSTMSSTSGLLVSGLLADEGYQTREAADSDAALEAIRTRRPSLVLLDIWLQGSRLDGLGILAEIKRHHPNVPVVMMSGHGTIETAVAAIKQGAYEFIEKPFQADRLLLAVERAIESARLRREVEELRQRAGGEEELLGHSSAISHLRQAIERVAPTGSRC